MLHEIITEMEGAELLDKETVSIVKKGSLLTISSVMVLGGATLLAAGIVSTANFMTNKSPDTSKESNGYKMNKGIL